MCEVIWLSAPVEAKKPARLLPALLPPWLFELHDDNEDGRMWKFTLPRPTPDGLVA